MSDHVDEMLERDRYFDDGMGQSDMDDYLCLTDDELRAECAKAREAKIASIRKWPHKLSKKQRWCLARWCLDRDEREMERELA